MDQETLSSQMDQDTSEQETIRREKLAQMRENGMDPYAHTTFPKTHLSRQIIDHYDELAEKTVSAVSYTHLSYGDGKHINRGNELKYTDAF